MNDNDLIERRSKLLAKVMLTRRLNIDVLTFEDKADPGIDFISTIRDENIPGFLPFGVVVWGTAKELQRPEEATEFARHKKRFSPRTQFFMPVILLLFSMQRDEAYFSWLVEPSKHSNKLLHVPEPRFTEFDLRQLDKMTKRITKWYGKMATNMVADEAELAVAHASDEG